MLIEWIKQAYETKEISDLPALYSLNPFKTTLLLVEVLKVVRRKFKSLQVQCINLEKYLILSLDHYALAIAREDTIEFLIQEKEMEGRDSLDLISLFGQY